MNANKETGVDFTNIFARLFLSKIFCKWRLANGAQIWQMAHKIQHAAEDFNFAPFLVKLSGVRFFSKSRAPASFSLANEVW